MFYGELDIFIIPLYSIYQDNENVLEFYSYFSLKILIDDGTYEFFKRFVLQLYKESVYLELYLYWAISGNVQGNLVPTLFRLVEKNPGCSWACDLSKTDCL